MENVYEGEDGVSSSLANVRGQDIENIDAADITRCADYYNNTWLISRRSTGASDTMGETTLGRHEGNIALTGERCKAALLSDDSLHNVISTKTREVPSSSRKVREIGEQVAYGIAPLLFPSIMMNHAVHDVLLPKTTTNQVAAEECSETQEAQDTQQKIATTNKRICSPTSMSARAESVIFSLRGATTWDGANSETHLTAKDRSCGSSEDHICSSEDSEKTSASSSRRSSGLAHVEGTAKCLEELVVHDEEELGEQHLRFERLQSFCGIIADEDYEFAPFDCSVEFSAPWNRKADDESQSRCRITAPVNLSKLCKLCSCEGASESGPAQLLRPLCICADFSVDPPGFGVAAGRRAFDEKTGAKEALLLRDATDNRVVNVETENDPTSPFEHACETVAVAVPAAASQFTEVEKLLTPADVPSCISCGHSMSCSRCYTRVAISAGDPFRKAHHNPFVLPSNETACSGVTHACAAASDKCNPRFVDQLAGREAHVFSIRGRCRGCASNIYCLTCLEHMQEQTAGLRSVADERRLQVAQGHGSGERRSSINFATPLAVNDVFPCPRFVSEEEGLRGVLRVFMRPQQLPSSTRGMYAGLALTRAKAHVGLVCKLNGCVGVHDMAELCRLQARDENVAFIDRQHGEAWGLSTICHMLLGTENVQEVLLSDCGGLDEKASLLSMSRAHVHAFTVDLTSDITEVACSVPVHGVTDDCQAKEELEKQPYLTSTYPSSHGFEEALEWRSSQHHRPQQGFGVVETSERDFLRPVLEQSKARDLTGTEEISGVILGTTCTMERKSYAARAERPRVDSEKTLDSEHSYFNVLVKHQEGRTRIGLPCENRPHSYCAAHEVQGLGEGRSWIQRCTGTCAHALRRCQDQACVRNREQASLTEHTHEDDQNLSFSRVGKRDTTYGVSSGATVHCCLVHECRAASATLLLRRGRNVHEQTSASNMGLRDSWCAHTLDMPVNTREEASERPRNEDCRLRMHQVDLRKYNVNTPSVAAGQQLVIDTYITSFHHQESADTSDMLQCHLDTKSLHGRRRRLVCNSLHVSPFAPGAGVGGGGLDEEAVSAASDIGTLPALLRSRTGFWEASTTCRDSGTCLKPCDGGMEAPETVPMSQSVQQRRRGNVATVNNIYPFPSKLEEKPERTRAAKACNQALFCETGVSLEVGKMKDGIKTNTVNPAAFSNEQRTPTAWNVTPVASPQHEASGISCEVQRDTRHWQHCRNSQESSTPYARDSAAAAASCIATLRKGGKKTLLLGKNSQSTLAYDSFAVASLSSNRQSVDSSCSLKLPALLYSESGTAPTESPGKIDALSLSVAVPHPAVRRPRMITQRWDRGQRRCASADFGCGVEFRTDSSAVGRPKTTSTGCASETAVNCARHERDSPAPAAHLDLNFMHRIQDDGSYVDASGAHLSTTAGQTKRRRLEGPLRARQTVTEREGKQLACSLSPRLSTATVSVGSTNSTRSGKSACGILPATTIPYHTCGERSSVVVTDGPHSRISPTGWMSGNLSSRGHADDDEQPTPNELRLAVYMNCKPASDLRPQPVCLLSSAAGTPDRCHKSQCRRTYGSGFFKGMPGEDRSDEICAGVDTGTTLLLDTRALSCLYECPASRSTDLGAWLPTQTAPFTRGDDFTPNGAAERATATAGMDSPRLGERPRGGARLGHCGSHQNAHENVTEDSTGEQPFRDWKSLREDVFMHQLQYTAGLVSRRPPSVTLRGTMPAGALRKEATAAASEDSAALPSFVGLQCSARRSCSVASVSCVPGVQEMKKKRFAFDAFVKHGVTDPADAAVQVEKHSRTGNRRNYTTHESAGTPIAVQPRAPRGPRYEIRNHVAHRKIDEHNFGGEKAGSETKKITCDAVDEQDKRQETEIYHSEEHLMDREAVISSAERDPLQNPRRLARTEKPAVVSASDTPASSHSKSLRCGAPTSIGRNSKGCKTSRAPGRRNHACDRESLVEARGSLSVGSASPTAAVPTAGDAAGRAVVYPAASLMEPGKMPTAACRRARRGRGFQAKADEGKKYGAENRATQDNVFTAEKTRQPWRTGADGKVLHDAFGRKISGVWYDTGRRLWRVVFTQGERRRTKGFSLRQYGFEQARNLAIQWKMAIEAGKALCNKEFS